MIESFDAFDNAQIDSKTYNVIESKCGLGIIHFIVRDFQKNFDELLIYIETAEDLLDMIVLSETGRIGDTEHFAIPNFNIYYNESSVNKCDGVVFYI